MCVCVPPIGIRGIGPEQVASGASAQPANDAFVAAILAAALEYARRSSRQPTAASFTATSGSFGSIPCAETNDQSCDVAFNGCGHTPEKQPPAAAVQIGRSLRFAPTMHATSATFEMSATSATSTTSRGLAAEPQRHGRPCKGKRQRLGALGGQLRAVS